MRLSHPLAWRLVLPVGVAAHDAACPGLDDRSTEAAAGARRGVEAVTA